jgi:predicted DNA-binding protein
MSKDTASLTPNPLFARKGEAAPAPAVGYVGVNDLRGKLDRRQAQRPYDGGERRHSVLDDIAGEVAPQPTPRAAPAATGAEGSLAKLIHRRGGPRRKAPAARQASKPPATASPARAQAKAAKPGRKRKRPRRQLTVRLPVEQFARFNALAKQSGYTYQDILATATSAYLEKTADEGKKKKGQAKRAKAGRRRAKSKR